MKLRIVCVQEGLGNQMFQYAFMLALKQRYPRDCVFFETGSFRYDRAHYGFELGKVFGITPRSFAFHFEERKLSRLHGVVRGVYEQGFGQFMPFTLRSLRPIIFYRGFWQSWRYAALAEEAVRACFRFREELISLRNRRFAEELRTKESVAIHIRAGDYYTNPEANALLGGICDADYYRNATEKMRILLPDARFFIFTNDPDWVVQNIPDLEGEFVNWNKGEASWADLYLMSRCRHNIIANSSFSWWGAWLNDYSDKIVIAPKRWFNEVEETNVIPDEWIQL